MSGSRGVPYFYHAQTQQSTWEPPSDLTQEQVQNLPGASKYLSGSGAVPEGQVRASHLLVKHRDSRRPSSWKEVSNAILLDICARWLTVHHSPRSPARRRRLLKFFVATNRR